MKSEAERYTSKHVLLSYDDKRLRRIFTTGNIDQEITSQCVVPCKTLAASWRGYAGRYIISISKWKALLTTSLILKILFEQK